jgi:hypothetical protein
MSTMDRRDLLRLGAAAAAAALNPALASAAPAAAPASPDKIEQWGLFELSLPGPSTGNPFKDVKLTAVFTLEHRTVRVTGFYDGEGTYRIRFMPDAPGRWSYATESSTHELAGHTGQFTCTAPTTPGNHGPVTTAHQFHFQYADGTRYFPFGTTTYAYLFASDEAARLSLEGMKQAKFSKTRACVLPKGLGPAGPKLLPYPNATADANGRNGKPDYTQFIPA